MTPTPWTFQSTSSWSFPWFTFCRHLCLLAQQGSKTTSTQPSQDYLHWPWAICWLPWS